MTRVVLVDDHPVFRRGLRALLEELGAEVVAEADEGEAGVAAALEHRPDVVLMDIQMEPMDGVEATRRLRAAWPEARILMLTMVDDDSGVLASLQAGARGYLLKGAGGVEIERALSGVAAGEAVYGPGVADRLASWVAGSGAPAEPFPQLSHREREILDLVARGLGNPVIAARLHLSDKTVRNYISSLFVKLGVRDRAQAIVAAREAGLGRSA